MVIIYQSYYFWSVCYLITLTETVDVRGPHKIFFQLIKMFRMTLKDNDFTQSVWTFLGAAAPWGDCPQNSTPSVGILHLNTEFMQGFFCGCF